MFDVPLLGKLADDRGISEAHLSLAWLLSKESVSVIPKSTNPEHLNANYEAQFIHLDAEAIERIDSTHELRQQRVNNPDNPAWKWQVSS